MDNEFDVNEGKTGANSVPAAFFGLIGIVLLTIYPLISIIMFAICGIFATMTEGVIFNFNTKKYRKYYALLGLKTGIWKSIPKAEEVHLKMNINSFSVKRWLPSESNSSGSATERIITFNIYFIKKNRQIKFYEFYNYYDAKKVLDILNSKLDINYRDFIEEKIEDNQ